MQRSYTDELRITYETDDDELCSLSFKLRAKDFGGEIDGWFCKETILEFATNAEHVIADQDGVAIYSAHVNEPRLGCPYL